MTIRQLLQDQSGQFWGGFLGGLNKSMSESRDRADKHKELELRKKQIDAQIKGMDADNEIKQHTLKQKMTELGSREELAKSFEGTPDNYQPPDFQNPENITSLQNQMINKSSPGTPGDPRRAAMVRAGLGREAVAPQPKSLMEQYQEMQMFQQAVGSQGQGGQQSQPQGTGAPAPAQQPPGVKFNSKGQGILSMPGEEKTPFKADDALYRSLMKKHNGNFEAARAEYDQRMKATNVARGEGTSQGGLNVRQTQPYLQNKTDISEATEAGKALPATVGKEVAVLDTLVNETVGNIRKSYDKNYLGPIKGTDWAFEGRRRVGSIVGGKVTGQETTFRTALKDAGDQLLRARSGAQINEQEYSRLRSILPQASDEPQVFDAALNRFENELRSLMKTKIGIATTPRGQLSQPVGAKQGRLTPIPGN